MSNGLLLARLKKSATLSHKLLTLAGTGSRFYSSDSEDSDSKVKPLLGDLSYTEFKNLHSWLMRHPRPRRLINDKPENICNIPDTVDWIRVGGVTQPENQGSRPTCWAFAVAASIEGFIKIKTGKLIKLSVEQLVQHNVDYCGSEYGFLSIGYALVVQNGGLTTWKAYPYGKRITKHFISAATIEGFKTVHPYNEHELKVIVSKQPVAVALNSSLEFRRYRGGIFVNRCGDLASTLDHCRAIVGYGTEDGVDYWMCKNSWGTKWGENGFVRMLRNTECLSGKCGIAIQPMYPI